MWMEDLRGKIKLRFQIPPTVLVTVSREPKGRRTIADFLSADKKSSLVS